VRDPSAETTLESRFFYQVFVVLLIVYMIAIRHKIAQMLGVFVTLADCVVFGMLISHA
jgi:hypothetical protein